MRGEQLNFREGRLSPSLLGPILLSSDSTVSLYLPSSPFLSPFPVTVHQEVATMSSYGVQGVECRAEPQPHFELRKPVW